MSYALLEPGTKNHFYKTRRAQVTLGVIHTAENTPTFQGNRNATFNLVRYAQQTTRAVSWHDTSGDDESVTMLPLSYTGFHVRGYNSRSVGDEQVTRANLWGVAPSDWTERILSNLVASTAFWVAEYDLPIRRITKAQADAGLKGFVAHGDLDPGRRTDPGRGFPWATYLRMLARALDASTAPDDVTPSGESIQVGDTLRFGDRGDVVKEWQKLLLQFNNRLLPEFGADGHFGGETHSATREFQKFSKIEDDGIVGPVTYRAMRKWQDDQLKNEPENAMDLPAWSGSWSYLKDGSSGSRVKTWQTALNAWRPNLLKVDSDFGPITERATVTFQRDQRLSADGIVGPKTWDRMRSVLR